jgi:hypothetical protein
MKLSSVVAILGIIAGLPTALAQAPEASVGDALRIIEKVNKKGADPDCNCFMFQDETSAVSSKKTVLNMPLIANNNFNTYCLEASLAMILNYYKYEGREDRGLDDAAKITGKKDPTQFSGAWKMYKEVGKLGFSVKVISQFDHKQFAETGYEYVSKFAGKNVADSWQSQTDLKANQRDAKAAAQTMRHEKRLPTLQDIKSSLDRKQPLIAYINTTPNLEKYTGHFVVIKGIDIQAKKILINNPGLPPSASEWSFQEFEKAFYGNDAESKKMSFLITFVPK